jgi:hypothetical protein
MKTARALTRLALTALLALPVAACNKSLGTIDFSGPFDMQFTMLRVYVENSGPSAVQISYRGSSALNAPAGQRVYLTPYISTSALPASDSFAIGRNGVTLAEVSFQPLRYPEKKGDIKDTTIVISEPSDGVFSATASESDWIRIAAVTRH